MPPITRRVHGVRLQRVIALGLSVSATLVGAHTVGVTSVFAGSMYGRWQAESKTSTLRYADRVVVDGAVTRDGESGSYNAVRLRTAASADASVARSLNASSTDTGATALIVRARADESCFPTSDAPRPRISLYYTYEVDGVKVTSQVIDHQQLGTRWDTVAAVLRPEARPDLDRQYPFRVVFTNGSQSAPVHAAKGCGVFVDYAGWWATAEVTSGNMTRSSSTRLVSMCPPVLGPCDYTGFTASGRGLVAQLDEDSDQLSGDAAGRQSIAERLEIKAEQVIPASVGRECSIPPVLHLRLGGLGFVYETDVIVRNGPASRDTTISEWRAGHVDLPSDKGQQYSNVTVTLKNAGSLTDGCVALFDWAYMTPADGSF